MRDPARIDCVLEVIREIWKTHPDLRLMQLLGNLPLPTDPYFVEDDQLETFLRQQYLTVKPLSDKKESS